MVAAIQAVEEKEQSISTVVTQLKVPRKTLDN